MGSFRVLVSWLARVVHVSAAWVDWRTGSEGLDLGGGLTGSMLLTGILSFVSQFAISIDLICGSRDR